MSHFWDRVGISASALCLIHCLATPFLVLLIPFVGEAFLHQWFHRVILIFVFPIAVWALWRGYRMHRLKTMLVLGAIGLLFMILAITCVNDQPIPEMSLMVLGGISLTLAHYLNLRACQKHHHHHH